jgi:hypothetical protein
MNAAPVNGVNLIKMLKKLIDFRQFFLNLRKIIVYGLKMIVVAVKGIEIHCCQVHFKK